MHSQMFIDAGKVSRSAPAALMKIYGSCAKQVSTALLEVLETNHDEENPSV